MSQNYLDSDWCNQELDWFLKTLEQRKDRLSREAAGRLWPIIIVSVGATAQRNWPHEVMQRGMPFEFFDKNEHARDPAPCLPVDRGNAGNPNFYEEFTSLETTLSRRIKKALSGDDADTATASKSVAPYDDDAEEAAGAGVMVFVDRRSVAKGETLRNPLRRKWHRGQPASA